MWGYPEVEPNLTRENLQEACLAVPPASLLNHSNNLSLPQQELNHDKEDPTTPVISSCTIR